jgi:hypothetical protein
MTPTTVIQTPFPKSTAIENVPKDGRRLRATNTRAKSMAINTVETNALMMVRIRVKIEKACEVRNRENIKERSAKPAHTGWRTRTTDRAVWMMLTMLVEIPASFKSMKEAIL